VANVFSIFVADSIPSHGFAVGVVPVRGCSTVVGGVVGVGVVVGGGVGDLLSYSHGVDPNS
jgi:hypothetical protein